MLLNKTLILSGNNMSYDGMNEFINNLSEINNFSMENISSEHPVEFGMPRDVLRLAVIIVRCSTGVVGLSALLLNCLVFVATSKISTETLKSKVFIQNAVAADILWAVESCYPVMSNTLKAYGALEVHAVVTAINNHIQPITMYYQLLSALLLVCDRLYAVLRPLTYHTVGYSTLAKVVLIASAWIGAIALSLPAVIIAFVGDGLGNKPFHLKLRFGFQNFTLHARQYILISVNVVIFILYVVIFVVLYVQKRFNRALEQSTSVNRKTTWVLTLTYFFIHISSLCFYLPGPLFKEIRKGIPNSVMSHNAKSVLSNTLFNLYILNSVVNPVILGYRIRVIRQYLYAVIKPRRHETNSKGPLPLQATSTTSTTAKSKEGQD